MKLLNYPRSSPIVLSPPPNHHEELSQLVRRRSWPLRGSSGLHCRTIRHYRLHRRFHLQECVGQQLCIHEWIPIIEAHVERRGIPAVDRLFSTSLRRSGDISRVCGWSRQSGAQRVSPNERGFQCAQLLLQRRFLSQLVGDMAPNVASVAWLASKSTWTCDIQTLRPRHVPFIIAEFNYQLLNPTI